MWCVVAPESPPTVQIKSEEYFASLDVYVDATVDVVVLHRVGNEPTTSRFYSLTLRLCATTGLMSVYFQDLLKIYNCRGP